MFTPVTARMIDSPSQPRRRWRTFSLRTLLVLMLVIGSALGALLHERRQIAGTNRLSRNGGSGCLETIGLIT
jgi:hypothetical protein